MATDEEVIALIRAKMNDTLGEFIRDVSDFIDYCIEWDIAPTYESYDVWLHGDRKSIFKQT